MRVLSKMKRLVSKQKLLVKGKKSSQTELVKSKKPSQTEIRASSPLQDELNALPETKERKKQLDKGRSTPNLSVSAPSPRQKIGPRSSSQPVLAAFVPAYVDQLKGQPFSLKEKNHPMV